MQVFATESERLAFLLEAEAGLYPMPLSVLGIADDADGQSQADAEDHPKYRTNYIGSKQKLVDWIWSHTPEGVGSVLDAFSGSSVVGYLYKTKGLAVHANDRLRYCHHIGRAIIENNGTTLNDEEIEALMKENRSAGTFVRDKFKGVFFAKGVHAVIDQIRANIDGLKGYKKDIALFALGKTCLEGGGFGHFTVTTQESMRRGTPDEFKERFQANLRKTNGLVFDNGKPCKATNLEVQEALAGAKADLAYFDPPYATAFSTTNYEKTYHFIEGLMTYWEGKKIDLASKVRQYLTEHTSVTRGNAKTFFENFLSKADHIANWIISYRDQSIPTEAEIKGLVASQGYACTMRSKPHRYNRTIEKTEASLGLERLFICKAKEGEGKKASLEAPVPELPCRCHTTLPVQVSLSSEADLAEGDRQNGDPQFRFVLCRVGTNRNGDHFTREELSERYPTSVGKKVDLKHSQDLTDIVGGILSADFVEDEAGGRVECVGELFVHESTHAQLAHKLMKKGIVSQVSMECDYQWGECSICGKKVASKQEYCTHLARYKGGEVSGKPCFEILHGVSFTGLGLLDRKGADENARITQVASEQPPPDEPDGADSHQAQTPKKHTTPQQEGQTAHEEGEKALDEEGNEKQTPDTEAAKKKPPPGGDDGGGGDTPPGEKPPASDPQARVKELEQENKTLKQQVMTLQKQVQEMESQQKAAANRAKAQKLVRKMEKNGFAFDSDEDREEEVGRLAGLSDDAFTATEGAYERLWKVQAKTAGDGGDAAKDQPGRKSTEASGGSGDMSSQANVRPRDVPDKEKTSLADRLKDGLMAAYEEHTGEGRVA